MWHVDGQIWTLKIHTLISSLFLNYIVVWLIACVLQINDDDNKLAIVWSLNVILICSVPYMFSDCEIRFCYWQLASRHGVRVEMSQQWVTLNQPPRKTDVENYMNSDRNIVWQELLRKNQLKSSMQCQRFPLSKCNPCSTGENKYINACVYLQ